MIGSILILLAAAVPAPAKPAAVPPAPPPVVCPAWGTKPAGCIEPPLKDRIAIYGSWTPELDRARLASGIIRAPVEVSRWDALIPLDRFPAALRRGEAETSASVELLLTIAPDDSVASCQAVEIKGYEGSQRERGGSPIALDPALGETACAIVREHRKFRHAIDRAGVARAAPLQLEVHFQRHRYDRALAPAPPPPSRWLGERAYDSSPGWPPRWLQSFSASSVRLTLPDWKAFLGGRKDLPKAAMVGVLLSLDRGGTVIQCKIGSTSADPALDAATCAALTSVRHQSTSGYPERDYPIEVRWKKDKPTVVMPVAPAPPMMIAPLLLSDVDLPGEPLPRSSIQMQVQIDPQGKPLSCRIVWSREGSDAYDARSCALLLERGRFTGGKDVFGRGAVGGFYVVADWQARKIAMAPGYF